MVNREQKYLLTVMFVMIAFENFSTPPTAGFFTLSSIAPTADPATQLSPAFLTIDQPPPWLSSANAPYANKNIKTQKIAGFMPNQMHAKHVGHA
jgi:hypothetical protein